MENETAIKIIYDAEKILKPLPARWWVAHTFHTKDGRHCALGLYQKQTSDKAAHNLADACFVMGFTLPKVNDGRDSRFKQSTPKQRVMAAFDSVLGATKII